MGAGPSRHPRIPRRGVRGGPAPAPHSHPPGRSLPQWPHTPRGPPKRPRAVAAAGYAAVRSSWPRRAPQG
eukprot:6307262-Alexandrium_andersonii.AAC.1